jgi:hypothetical protein
VSLATKNTIVELMLLALAQSPLKDLGLDAMRGVLASDPRLAVLDGAVDLEPIWELLEGQPAGQCRPTRENIDRAIEGAALKESAPRPKAKYDQTTPLYRPVSSVHDELTTKRKVLAVISAAVVLASLVIVGYTLFSETASEPRYTKIDTALFAGDIPLRSAEKWGGEVHAALADPTWLKQPDDKRRKQLETAMQRLADQQLGVLIIEDDAKKARAVGQMFGKPPKVYVKFY